jgi:hypothetical protein
MDAGWTNAQLATDLGVSSGVAGVSLSGSGQGVHPDPEECRAHFATVTAGTATKARITSYVRDA